MIINEKKSTAETCEKYVPIYWKTCVCVYMHTHTYLNWDDIEYPKLLSVATLGSGGTFHFMYFYILKF